MSLEIDITNTPTSPVTEERVVNPAPVNYNADWRISDQKPNEVTLVNLNSALDAPMKVRVAWSQVPDVFKNSGVEPSSTWSGDTKRQGVSVLIQLTGASLNGEGLGPFPWSAHLVMRLPVGGGVDHEDILQIVTLLLGHLFDTGASDLASRTEALLRGAIAPVDL